MISKFFIERPVLANVLAILMVVIGGVALLRLAVAQYPNVVPPTISVTTRYPGASARAVVDTVALPIEQQVNGVDGMIYMQSYSASDGSYTLIVTFKIGMDINFAQVLVQNRVSSALAQLPQAVQAQGVTVQQKSTAILQFVTLTSPDDRYDSLFLANYATISLQPELARLPGVGQVNIFGMPPAPNTQAFQYTLDIAGRFDDVSQFENIVVKTESNGQMVYVRDVGRVELGAQTYSQVFTLNGKPSAGIGIFQTLEANALDVAGGVAAKMKELAKSFPPGLTYTIPFDTTTFVRASINEVWKTLFEAAILVLLVIVVFLQDWRAMLVPMTTVPVTIIGAFAAMAALGFTINLSTLFAIVLAIGIVVDDAIVVVEGAAHHIERGLPRKEAAIRAMDELFGPIVGITLVLMSVFLPAAFIPGLTGKMFAQFALVIAATAFLSAVNAATLKPTQCALWLRAPVPPNERNLFFRAFNAVYDPFERAYARLIGAMVARSGLMCVIALIVIAIAGYGLSRVASGFLPIEDQGYVLVTAQLPDGASLVRTKRVLDQVGQIAGKNPAVANVIGISGVSALDNNSTLANAGVAYVVL
ncbi:MAG: efflux RND transporter permease subunit, partial [Alphaproteobacteria bacterium]